MLGIVGQQCCVRLHAALYPSASVPSNWIVPRVLSKSSAQIERKGRLVEEDLRNEVGAKYTFLNWPIDIDACSHRFFDTQVDLAFNEFFSPFNPFNHILLVFILFVQPVEILRSLRNDDGDGYKNVTKKVNLSCPKLNLAHSISLNSSDVAKLFWSWILKDCIKVQEKKKKVVVFCSRPQQTWN